MNFISASYNMYHNSIDFATFDGYILRIDCNKAEEGLKSYVANSTNFKPFYLLFLWHFGQEEWYLSIVDVVCFLTDSIDPKQYIKKMRQRNEELSYK